MGLGLTLIGLMVATLVVAGGQIWTSHQALQDALDNAVMSMQEAHQTSATLLTSLVQSDDPGLGSLTVLSLSQTSNGTLMATVQASFTPTVWPTWLGARPVDIEASD